MNCGGCSLSPNLFEEYGGALNSGDVSVPTTAALGADFLSSSQYEIFTGVSTGSLYALGSVPILGTVGKESADGICRSRGCQRKLSSLLEAMSETQDWVKGALENEDLFLGMVAASGAVIYRDGSVIRSAKLRPRYKFCAWCLRLRPRWRSKSLVAIASMRLTKRRLLS